jgi:hypothetical protein
VTNRKALGKVTLVLMSVVVLACHTYGQPQQKASGVMNQDAAVETLRRYLQLRLRNADWKDYSQFITWPDEPSWDCAWVISKYDIGVPQKGKRNVEVPVAYNRIGLFCYDFEFNPDPKLATINYELVERQGAWKIDAPIPDYPDISADVLLNSLRASSGDPRQSVDHRAKFSATVRKITEVLDRTGAK